MPMGTVVFSGDILSVYQIEALETHLIILTRLKPVAFIFFPFVSVSDAHCL